MPHAHPQSLGWSDLISQLGEVPPGVDVASITSIVVSAPIIRADGKVLLLLRDDLPMWTGIGGFVDDDESIKQSLHREIAEEIGLTHNTHYQCSPRYTTYYQYTKRGIQCESMYRVELNPNALPQLGNDGVKIEWFDIDQLPLNMSNNQRTRLVETYHCKKNPTHILRFPDTAEQVTLLSPAQMYGLDEWLNAPRVVAKRRANLLRWDLGKKL